MTSVPYLDHVSGLVQHHVYCDFTLMLVLVFNLWVNGLPGKGFTWTVSYTSCPPAQWKEPTAQFFSMPQFSTVHLPCLPWLWYISWMTISKMYFNTGFLSFLTYGLVFVWCLTAFAGVSWLRTFQLFQSQWVHTDWILKEIWIITLLFVWKKVCVAGVVLGDIDLHFAWQAWSLVTSILILRGRCGTYGTRLALCQTPSLTQIIVTHHL